MIDRTIVVGDCVAIVGNCGQVAGFRMVVASVNEPNSIYPDGFYECVWHANGRPMTARYPGCVLAKRTCAADD